MSLGYSGERVISDLLVVAVDFSGYRGSNLRCGILVYRRGARQKATNEEVEEVEEEARREQMT